jgi:hypothetical protein
VTELIRLTRGVWRPGTAVADLRGRCAALLSAMPTGTVIGGMTAAELHGLWLPNGPLRPIELIIRRDGTLPREMAGSRRHELRARRRAVLDDEIAWIDGLPLTSEARTWVDLAEWLTMPDLVAAGDCVLRGGPTTDDLRRAVQRSFRHRGVVRARAALPLLDARSRSRPESHMRYALVAARLPTPEVNAAIYTDHGEWLAEPDLHYPRARLALEYNGADHSEPRRMRRDITRDLDILQAGWKSITFGPSEVFGRPDILAGIVRDELRRRDPAWRRRPR